MTNKEFIESISLDGEEWRDAVGYEGLYVISNLGRFAALKRIVTTKAGWQRTHKATIIKPRRNSKKTTHLVVFPCIDGVHHNEYVHRLVAIAFIPNPDNLPMVEHLDCDPTNNRVENLRWTTQTGNMNNPITVQRMSKSQRKKKLPMLRKPVVCIRPDNSIVFYESMSEAKKDGFTTGGISRACHGEIKQTRGCKFMFLSDYEASLNQQCQSSL